jgi:hypothetical protein
LSQRKQKLELTWIGKENQPRLEPRILIEDPEKSYPPTKIPTTPNPSLTKADQPPPAPSLTKEGSQQCPVKKLHIVPQTYLDVIAQGESEDQRLPHFSS